MWVAHIPYAGFAFITTGLVPTICSYRYRGFDKCFGELVNGHPVGAGESSSSSMLHTLGAATAQ